MELLKKNLDEKEIQVYKAYLKINNKHNIDSFIDYLNELVDLSKITKIRLLQKLRSERKKIRNDDLKGELRPYQLTGLKWLWTNISKGFGCCIADDMGLGKTIQVISLILKLKEENKLKQINEVMYFNQTFVDDVYKNIDLF